MVTKIQEAQEKIRIRIRTKGKV